jgi:ABC-type uncharacterized transport system involved in gliding motility auxiliary subunit
MNSKIFSLILVGLITVFAIHIIYIQGENARLDLTETGLYSLTDGTHQILDRMNDEGVKPVDVTLYFSETTGKSLPRFIKNFITYQQYVENLLQEYERYSAGKVRVDVIDPKPDSDEAQDASDFGLDGKPINQHGDRFFFGLVFHTQTGSRDVIDFLWPEKQETIEYEISKKLYNLIWPTKKRLGIMSALEPLPDNNPYMRQLMQAQGRQPTNPWASMEVMKEEYEISMIGDVDTISKDEYDLVMVLHPKDFSQKQIWALNEWIVTGGNAVVFIDPYSVEDRAPQNPQQPWAQMQHKPASNLNALTEGWGLQYQDDTFALDSELALARPDRSGATVKFLPDLNFDERMLAANASQDSPIFQGLTNIRLFTPGILSKSEDTSLTYETLLKTTDQGDAVVMKPGFGDQGTLSFMSLQDPDRLIREYSPEGEKALAFLIRGQFPDAFPEGASFPAQAPERPPGLPPGMEMPVPEDAEMITKEALAEDAKGEATVVVFADSDFISDQLAFQNSFFGLTALNDNYKVLLNTVDYLLGSSELMNVRSKKNIRRPFEVFDQIEAEADRQLLAEEQKIRADIARFQEELREKQRGMNQNNAVLLQKQVQDEINALNEQISAGERDLREIRKQKRAALEGQETMVSQLIVGFAPLLVLMIGLFSVYSRRARQKMLLKE